MSGRRALVPVVVAGAVGLALWSAIALISGKREPWDASSYWVLAYPAAIAVCAWLGYAYPDRPWRWSLVLFEAQWVATGIRNGELGNLWPLGALMFAIVAVPGMLAGRLAARFGRRAEERAA